MSTTKGTVLVVDSDDTAQSMVAGILQEAGFGVVRVYDAVSALCVQAALALDAVVAASNVPGMEGTAILKMMRDLNPELPLIFVTDRPSRDTEALAAADGASCYFCKPFDLATFHKVGDDAIMSARAARALRLAQGSEESWH
jgi:DNA-binding response OmpR family regulator